MNKFLSSVRLLLASTALATSILSLSTSISYANGVVPSGKCAFTVASRKTLSDVRAYLSRDLHRSHKNYIRVAKSKNGWYAISVGDVPKEDFPSIKRRLVSKGEVPTDSYCSNGSSYVRIIAPSDYRTASSPSPSRPTTSSNNNPYAAEGLAAGVVLGGALIACSLGGILGADCFSSKDPSPSKITFRNNCPHDDVRIAVRYLDTDDRWKTKAWWNFEYGEKANLVSNNETLWTNNAIIYYYAETVDGSISWTGDQLIEYGESDLYMKKFQTSSDKINVTLVCENGLGIFPI